MIAHWRYLLYVLRHKWFVLVAGRRTGAPLWRLLIHDWSKFMPVEWFPYVAYFYGPSEPPAGAFNYTDPSVRPNHSANAEDWKAARQAAFDRAWLHHQHVNPHHWQHWVLREDSGATKALPMPGALVREMVADWMGAGRAITGRWEAAEWYEKNRHKMVLHPDTQHLVEVLLSHHGNATCACGATGSVPSFCRRMGYCEAHMAPMANAETVQPENGTPVKIGGEK